MKEKKPIVLTVLRGVANGIEQKAKETKKDISDDITLDILAKNIKQRIQSIDAYKQANRGDLVQKENVEKVIISHYLPEQLSDEEITSIIDEAIKKTAATNMKDMGKVMGSIKDQVKGKADMKTVSKRIAAILSIPKS